MTRWKTLMELLMHGLLDEKNILFRWWWNFPFSAEPWSLLWISGVIIIIACWKPSSQCFARWVRLGPICVSDSTWICLNPTIPHLSYKENFKHSFKNFNYDKNRYNNNFIIYLLWKLFFSFHVSKKRKLKNI